MWIVWKFNKYILARFSPLYNKWVIPNPFLLAQFCQRKKKEIENVKIDILGVSITKFEK
jgi:hypothetical protein